MKDFAKFFKRYERFLVPGMLLLGLLVDIVTFRTINVQTTLLLLGFYTVIAAGSIVVLNKHIPPDPTPHFALHYARLVSPLALQFSFGALLSGSLIFYWFSGAFSVSWPIIVTTAVLMVSNDQFRHFFARPAMQIGVFYFILFSLFSLVFPFAFNSVDPHLFLVAGMGSFVVMSVFLQWLSARIESIKKDKRPLAAIVLAIFFAMNALYAGNIIPPIPLSLREGGVYHRIGRTGGTYRLSGEHETILERLLPGQTLHLANGEGAAVWSAIFAPADLNTTIVHAWYLYDEASRAWSQKDRLSFPLLGGRKDGFRGYSRKSSVVPGKWRVDVQTTRGQVLGRIRFDVVRADSVPTLQEIKR